MGVESLRYLFVGPSSLRLLIAEDRRLFYASVPPSLEKRGPARRKANRKQVTMQIKPSHHRRDFFSLLSPSLLAFVAATFLTVLTPARGQLTIDDPLYTAGTYYTNATPTTSDSIISYDWDSSQNLYFITTNSNDYFGGFYEFSGGTTSTLAPSNSSDYAGANVVSIGNYVYYNDGFGQIYNYGPTNGGSPTVTPVSTATNYGLYKSNGQLFITGAPDGTNHIYNVTLAADGSWANNPVTDLGADSGGSGPLAFDNQGNLYYAPGYGDQSIYKWTAAEVAAAIANPEANPLTATLANLWVNYSSLYGSFVGGTSMIVENGELLVTLTDFGGPSDLVAFGIDSSGAYTNTATTILNDNSDALGELRTQNGNLYLSDGNTIYTISPAPEPSTYLLLGLGLLLLVGIKWRKSKIGLNTASMPNSHS